jgi:hypothetical protein
MIISNIVKLYYFFNLKQMPNIGNLKPFLKGYDPRRAGNGRPKTPKNIKDLLQEIENVIEKGELKIIVKREEVRIFTDKETKKKMVEVKLTTAQALNMAFLKQMKGGNHKFWDMAFKLNYAGGYEPLKTQHLLEVAKPQNLETLTDEELELQLKLLQKIDANTDTVGDTGGDI